VVPVDETQWRHDPFAAELIDDEIWGRGAVDMLYLTASFATVFRAFAEQATTGQGLAGDLVFMGVADEEGGSRLGMQWLMREHPDLIAVDEVLTEAGGMRIGERIAVSVAEKGSAGRRLHITGRSGHASAPFGSTNPIDLLGEVVQSLSAASADTPHAHPLWHQFVEARWGDTPLAHALTDPSEMDACLPELGTLAGYAHAVTRTTISPTVVQAGQAHNVIPASATVDLDVRPLPGVSDDDVDALLAAKLRPVSDHVQIERLFGWNSSVSPTDTPLFEAVADVLGDQLGCEVVPIMAAGGSDARFFRYAGIPAYGFGVLSDRLSYEEYRSRIHSHDERIDVDSVRLTVNALVAIVSKRLKEI
jgi:acetylornithine deacetylase/succinyl-diaminopimelate desuccinylase-like protein